MYWWCQTFIFPLKELIILKLFLKSPHHLPTNLGYWLNYKFLITHIYTFLESIFCPDPIFYSCIKNHFELASWCMPVITAFGRPRKEITWNLRCAWVSSRSDWVIPGDCASKCLFWIILQIIVKHISTSAFYVTVSAFTVLLHLTGLCCEVPTP